jgi:hypothetical protein
LEGQSAQGQLWFGAYPAKSSLRWEFNTLPVWRTNAHSPDFAFEIGSFGWLVFVPHYALMLFPAACATLPWLRWRFSLRTLLILMTLAAAVLGLVVYAVRG